MNVTDNAVQLLVSAARELGWDIAEVATVEEFEAAALARLDRVKGGQDHGHARNGIMSAINAAHAGDAAYVRAGLWEAAKVLELHHYDRNPARME